MSWNCILVFSGTDDQGQPATYRLVQCPECAAVIWEVNAGLHERWHKGESSDVSEQGVNSIE